MSRRAEESFAIIGMACRFPGADDYEQFWKNLVAQTNSISVVPPDRWDADRYYSEDPEAPNRSVSKWGGFIRDPDRFDAEFFGISPREARVMDPQQRVVLEMAWGCIEDAGYAPTSLAGTPVGVFIGVTTFDYREILARAPEIEGHITTGYYATFIPSRISYFLDLRGPSVPVDGACGSSLVALHQAMDAIRNGDCDQALVGGVSILSTPTTFISLGKLSMLSPTGQCRTFDADANGYVRGEGAGMVLIKPLARAIADGDAIRGVVRGSAVNHGGRARTLTSPGAFAQSKVISAAFRRAGVAPATVSYIEAHGTGTPLGDPIEVTGLKRAFRELHDPTDASLPPLRCGLGAVKTNVGHLEPTAGMAGLIKVLLSMERAKMPGLANFEQLNPRIKFAGSPFFLVTETTDWPAIEAPDGTRLPRRAGVSSFGIGGVNAHVVLEEAPGRALAGTSSDRVWQVFTLAARTDAALSALAQRHAGFLETHADARLEDVCLTANTGRSPMEHRVAIVTASIQALSAALRAIGSGREAAGTINGVAPSAPPKVAFLFTGQGSQYPGMSRELYDSQPVFREALDRCATLLRAHLERPLLEVIFSVGAQAAELDQTAYTQPALFAVEYALAALWQSFGVTPAAVLGHSVGEYVAACIAGVFSLEDGLRLIAARGRLMQTLPRDGAMAVAMTSTRRVEAAIRPYAGQVAIAALNGPENVVFSGRAAAVGEVAAALRMTGVTVTPLSVSHAFHSPLVEPILDEFERVAASVTYSKPRIAVISNVTGTLAGAELTTPAYWRRHIREPVRFADGMSALRAQECTEFIETGPHPVLIGMARAGMADDSCAWCSSLRRGQSDWKTLLESVGHLFVRGVQIDWQAVHRGAGGVRIPLPTYAFQGERYWIRNEANSPASPQGILSSALAPERRVELISRLTASGRFTSEQAKLLPEMLEVLRGLERKADDVKKADELLYQVQWREQELTASASAGVRATWIIFGDEGGLGLRLAGQFVASGVTSWLVEAGVRYELLPGRRAVIDPLDAHHYDRLLADVAAASAGPIAGIAYLWGLGARADDATFSADWDVTLNRSTGGALRLEQALVRADSPKPPRLWLVTRQAVPVGDVTIEAVAQAPLWGLGACIAYEAPDLRCGRIDLGDADEISLCALADEMLADSPEDRVALRGARRLVARLARPQAHEFSASGAVLDRPGEGAYLITGGLGALGLRFARWLVDRGARHVVLVGRSAPNDATEAALALLRQRGATISVRALDVSNAVAVASLVAEFGSSRPALRGVIHAAGNLHMALLAEQRWELFSSVFRAKIAGAWHLHRATRHLRLDFFLLFSSLSALLGDPGNANYGAANAFLDALACARRSQGLTALSINWGAWGEIGMAADAEVLQRIARRGMLALSVDEGLGAAERALVAGKAQVGVMALDWPKLLRTTVPTPILQDFAVTAQPGAAESAADFRNELESAVLERRSDLLVEHLRAQVARVIGAEDLRTITPERGFFSLGMDSLTSVELRNRLQRSLRIALPATVAFDYPTVDALAGFLRRDVLPARLFGVEAVALAPAPAAAAAAAMMVDDVPITITEETDEAAIARELAELQTVLSRGN